MENYAISVSLAAVAVAIATYLASRSVRVRSGGRSPQSIIGLTYKLGSYLGAASFQASDFTEDATFQARFRLAREASQAARSVAIELRVNGVNIYVERFDILLARFSERLRLDVIYPVIVSIREECAGRILPAPGPSILYSVAYLLGVNVGLAEGRASAFGRTELEGANRHGILEDMREAAPRAAILARRGLDIKHANLDSIAEAAINGASLADIHATLQRIRSEHHAALDSAFNP